jgi:fatty acid desaturase
MDTTTTTLPLGQPSTDSGRHRGQPAPLFRAAASRPVPSGSGDPNLAELGKVLVAGGFFHRQPRYYAALFASVGCLLAGGLAVLALGAAAPAWVHLLDAVFLALVFGQVGMLGHDVAHMQVFGRRRMATFVGLILANLLLGISLRWWRESHGAHHSHPNHDDLDPSLLAPVLAFSPQHATTKPGWAQPLLRHQAALVPAFACLQLLNLNIRACTFLLARARRAPMQSAVEGGLIALHVIGYTTLILAALGPALGLAFMMVHRGLTGLYLASVFAPNHKGMPLVHGNGRRDFFREQVVTSRDLAGGWFVDLWFGGLNFQIEHHLFPSMPRNNLRKAAPIIERYCQQHGIPYVVTGVIESYRMLFADLNFVSTVLKRSDSGRSPDLAQQQP